MRVAKVFGKTRRCREMIKQDVLNAGYVRLVEYMGGDESVIRIVLKDQEGYYER
jgi:hypothetical protein